MQVWVRLATSQRQYNELMPGLRHGGGSTTSSCQVRVVVAAVHQAHARCVMAAAVLRVHARW